MSKTGQNAAEYVNGRFEKFALPFSGPDDRRLELTPFAAAAFAARPTSVGKGLKPDVQEKTR
ncbi:hypothetical protein [Paracoccus angustae]|uniref:hypothetical protein n=1 Tax=Paracoccus angustae TaxID=1671480 RepID=UPI00366E0CC1